MYDTTKPGNGFVHWAAVNVEGNEAARGAALSGANLIVHNNDFGAVGYGGPTPPSGTHTYHIVVYALKEKVAASAGDPQDFGQTAGNNTWKKSKEAFENYLGGKDNIIASGQLVAKYK